ncbi:MAG: family 78 glycoside hydrolase catalytic domain [Lachnospiraceae bacterium]
MNEYIPVNLRCEYEREPLGVQKENPLFSWQTECKQVNGYQSAYQIVAASSQEYLRGEIYDIWNTGKIIGSRCYGIIYSGKTLTSGLRVYWKVRIWNEQDQVSEYSQPAWFEMGLLRLEDWKGNWMSFLGGLIGNGILMRYFFKTSEKKIAAARAYVCCAGYYELRLNGKKIGTKVLDPAPSDYSKTLLYSVYDVTEDIKTEGNVIGLILGTGWAGLPKVLVQLNIEYEDGSRQEEFTDWGIGWCVAKGPITYNSIYDGEDYDARLEKEGWDTPEYEPRFLKEHQRPNGWILATVVEDPGGRRVGQLLPPVRRIGRSEPKYLGRLKDKSLLYDAGKNQTGWVRLSASGEAGAMITLSFAEELNEEGCLDRVPLRLARCEDSYILKGGKEEEYAPRFTYHGFRYFTVQVEGKASVKKLTVEFVHSDLKENAGFDSGNEFLNDLARVMKHTDACNLMGIPTDSAQRDERHGWTTDTTSRAEGCTYHFDMGSFFEKWAWDVYDTQNDKGYFADTAPFRWGRRPCDPQVNTPISLVRLMDQVYGNRRLMEETYDNMLRYLQVLLKEADHWLISRTGFGEWACPPGECYPEEYGAGAVSRHVTATLVSTAYLYFSISQIKEMAEILGREDVGYLSGLKESVYHSYQQRFFQKSTAQYDQGSQSSNALSLELGLVEEKNRAAVVKNIVEDIKAHNYHMTTGNMGTKALLEVLCKNGEDDTAYELMMADTAPSFGYMLKKGATAIWERWEADRDNNIMNSRNQPMLAAACVWFYKYLGGIRVVQDGEGLQQLLLAPSVPEKLPWVHVEMDVLNGHVVSSWRQEPEQFLYEIQVPFNTRAEVRLPKKCGQVCRIFCSGQTAMLKKPVETEHSVIYRVGCGQYSWVCRKQDQ